MGSAAAVTKAPHVFAPEDQEQWSFIEHALAGRKCSGRNEAAAARATRRDYPTHARVLLPRRRRGHPLLVAILFVSSTHGPTHTVWPWALQQVWHASQALQLRSAQALQLRVVYRVLALGS